MTVRQPQIVAGMTRSLDGLVADASGSAGALYTDLEELRDAPYMAHMQAETGAVVMGRRASGRPLRCNRDDGEADAEADGDRTHLDEILAHTGFEDRDGHQARRRLPGGFAPAVTCDFTQNPW